MDDRKTTIDHSTIRGWAEARDGVPATVRGTRSGKNEAGILRFDFPGGAGEDDLEQIGWDEWFAKFEKENLALLYQDDAVEGGEFEAEGSTFFQLIDR